jgi:hypothetical protein
MSTSWLGSGSLGSLDACSGMMKVEKREST